MQTFYKTIDSLSKKLSKSAYYSGCWVYWVILTEYQQEKYVYTQKYFFHMIERKVRANIGIFSMPATL